MVGQVPVVAETLMYNDNTRKEDSTRFSSLSLSLLLSVLRISILIGSLLTLHALLMRDLKGVKVTFCCISSLPPHH